MGNIIGQCQANRRIKLTINTTGDDESNKYRLAHSAQPIVQAIPIYLALSPGVSASVSPGACEKSEK